MSVYKIFAAQDATLYSETPTLNSGMDAILETSKFASALFTDQSTAARSIIKFSDSDIAYVSASIIGNYPFKAYLRMFLADASGLPADFTIISNPIYSSWDMGTGRYLNIPVTIDGVCWTYRNANNTTAWLTGSYPSNVTSSYISGNPGGGNWYYNYFTTQSFGVYTEKDVELDVTDMVKAMLSGSIINNGFIVRNSGSIEFDENYSYKLSYFSRDTNTIYPPVLEFRWDDSIFSVSGAAGTSVSSHDIMVTIGNNKEPFMEDEIYRFRLNVRDKYPVRTYSTSSLFTLPKYLPSSSYFAIRDAKSDMPVVDFNNTYTKISADRNGNYFDVHMNGLEPERYYKLLVKTIISGSTVVFDDQYFFKIKE